MDDSNSVTYTGPISREPYYRETQRGIPVANFYLIVATQSNEAYLKVVAWRDVAQLVEAFHAGDVIKVTGTLQADSWTKPDGTQTSRVIILAESLEKVSDDQPGFAPAPRNSFDNY